MNEIRKNAQLKKGIVLILISATMTATGQLLWKLSADGKLIILFIGFCLYGLGAITMTIAFKFGDISILHPMLGFSLVLSIIYGNVFLNEYISKGKIIGIMLILCGLLVLAKSNRIKEKE